MLILSRKVNENIVIDGRIIVKIVRLDGENVKLGIEAPADVPVHRQEVYDEIQRSNREAATTGRVPVPRVPRQRRPLPGGAPPPSAVEKPPGDTHSGSTHQ
ncbi:MAG: carbon storage regulator CsrA [Verrucomicrobia bacterium]|nr:carbon storage regulator CsrA [Verrucomicrobiota bacterium]MBI3869064.1 carbon storage regulator CsrA [Verrucomicrobiota bacterium]